MYSEELNPASLGMLRLCHFTGYSTANESITDEKR